MEKGLDLMYVNEAGSLRGHFSGEKKWPEYTRRALLLGLHVSPACPPARSDPERDGTLDPPGESRVLEG